MARWEDLEEQALIERTERIISRRIILGVPVLFDLVFFFMGLVDYPPLEFNILRGGSVKTDGEGIF